MMDPHYVDRAIVIGPTCAGKGAISRLLSENTRYKTFSRYQVVRDYAVSLGIENPNWRQLWNLDQELMKEYPLRVILSEAVRYAEVVINMHIKFIYA